MNSFSVLSCLVVAALSTAPLAQQATQSPAHGCHPGSYRFKGVVAKGQTFSREFDGFGFALIPIDYGWMIDVSQGQQHYLANMTGPRHVVPSATEIEGWHFRNADNAGPNSGDVNAPQTTRHFLFSPRWPKCQEATGLERDGQGILSISNMELSGLKKGEQARIIRMRFTVVLTVGPSACMPCPVPEPITGVTSPLKK
jgi:hypothetical protein